MRDDAGTMTPGLTPLPALPPEVTERIFSLCDSAPLIIFDLETTGTDRFNDRIIDIAALRFAAPNVMSTLVLRVNPGIRSPRETTAIHGISDDDVREAPAFAAVAPEVAMFFEGADMAGYNIRAFDIPVLVKEFERAHVPFSMEGRRIVDSQTIFFKKEPRDLSAAVRLFAGREHTSAHQALADVVASVEVLSGQLGRYADLPRSISGLHDFSVPTEGRWVDPDKRFFWRDGQAVFNFSDYRGRSLSDVAESNPGFLEWILNRDFPEEAKRIVRDARRGVFPTREPAR
jgi:DNA polymerase-3 subunit epsilon